MVGRPALISMPWNSVFSPSIQVGILSAVLRRAGHDPYCFSAYLPWLDHIATQLGDDALPLYTRISEELYSLGVGDWVFAGYVSDDTSQATVERYRRYLRGNGVDSSDTDQVLTLRQLVPAFVEEWAERVLDAGCTVVGLTSCFSQNLPSLALAKALKERSPSVQVLFGGANCEGPMGVALIRSFEWIDAVARGEGEDVIVPLVRALAEGRHPGRLPGLCLRRGGELEIVPEGPSQIRLADVPLPDYDEYFTRLRASEFATTLEFSSMVALPVESSRGCWYGAKHHCTFCGLNGSTMAYRSKPAEQVVRELTQLADRHGRLDFAVVDNILDQRYLTELMPSLAQQMPGIRLAYEVKANLTRPQLHALYHAGVRTIQPGIESLDTGILRAIRKGVTTLQNLRILRYCAEFDDLHVEWNIIVGFPDPPSQAYQRIADLIPLITHLPPPRLVRLRLDRFSPYFNQAEELGIHVEGPLDCYEHVYDVDPGTLWDLAYYFRYRYCRPQPPTPLGLLDHRVQTWRTRHHESRLVQRTGPGLLLIEDRRVDLPARNHVLTADQAAAYAALADGGTVRKAADAARMVDPALSEHLVADWLAQWVEAKLLYQEDRYFLSLATRELGRVDPADRAAPAEQSHTSSQHRATLAALPTPSVVRQQATTRATGSAVPRGRGHEPRPGE